MMEKFETLVKEYQEAAGRVLSPAAATMCERFTEGCDRAEEIGRKDRMTGHPPRTAKDFTQWFPDNAERETVATCADVLHSFYMSGYNSGTV